MTPHIFSDPSRVSLSRLTTRAGRCASHVHGVAPSFPTGCGEINELLGDDQQPDDPDLALLHQGGAHPSTRAVLDPRHEGELGRVVSFHRAGLALVPPRSNIAPTCARLVPLRRGTPICVLSTRRTRPTRATTEHPDYEVRIVGTVKRRAVISRRTCTSRSRSYFVPVGHLGV